METSFFIARLIGPILIVVGLASAINPKLLEEVGREFLASRALLFLAGILALVIGLIVVNVHNVWVADWPVIITVFGWGAIASGVVRTAFPHITISMGEAMLSNRALLFPLAVVQLALGVWLSWVGYV